MVAATAQGSESLEMSKDITVRQCSNPTFRCAVAETQGRRPSYEDAHAITFAGEAAAFWVFDGHRGDLASKFAAETFPKELGTLTHHLLSDKRIIHSFKSVDRKLRNFLSSPIDGRIRSAGSTVVGALAARMCDGTYSAKLANCGDSRGVIIRAPHEEEDSAAAIQIRLPESLDIIRKMQNASWSQDASWLPEWPAVVETIDHKPGLWAERARIEAAGGTVCGGRCARLDGNLAVSRGLGDFDFKGDCRRSAAEQKVSCLPDIYEVRGLRPGSVLLLACDGLWDVISSEDAATFVRERLQRQPAMTLGEIAEELIEFSLEEKSGDNVTVLLAQFGSSSEYEDEWS